MNEYINKKELIDEIKKTADAFIREFDDVQKLTKTCARTEMESAGRLVSKLLRKIQQLFIGTAAKNVYQFRW
ncbi:hypothetical protein [Anaerocolumna sp.]|uniref:hypothetical protein n=1 Tax=Anaerocolumna sp. TaxID=2041569 RepID=UPI0028B02283|nr:hypothetical protein [Anaerocolumna sp.]